VWGAVQSLQDNEDAPQPDAEIVVVSAPPVRKANPAASSRDIGRPVTVEDDRLDTTRVADADSVLMTERFAAVPESPSYAGRADKLRARIEEVARGDVRFADVTVRCRRTVCQLAGRVTQNGAPAGQAAAFGLVHQEEIVSIGAAEGLEPGPLAITESPTGDATFLAYMVSA